VSGRRMKRSRRASELHSRVPAKWSAERRDIDKRHVVKLTRSLRRPPAQPR
jgi:hypothetical protein